MVGFIKGTLGRGRVHQGGGHQLEEGFIKGALGGGRVQEGDAHRRQKDLE